MKHWTQVFCESYDEARRNGAAVGHASSVAIRVVGVYVKRMKEAQRKDVKK
jgi:hypothetical protein